MRATKADIYKANRRTLIRSEIGTMLDEDLNHALKVAIKFTSNSLNALDKEWKYVDKLIALQCKVAAYLENEA